MVSYLLTNKTLVDEEKSKSELKWRMSTDSSTTEHMLRFQRTVQHRPEQSSSIEVSKDPLKCFSIDQGVELMSKWSVIPLCKIKDKGAINLDMTSLCLECHCGLAGISRTNQSRK